MKVLLLNGSPRKEGCTFTALSEVAKTLNQNGIDTEIFQAGDPDKDNVKAAAAKLKEADALVVGSPVYWASPQDRLLSSWISFAPWQAKTCFTNRLQQLLLQEEPELLLPWMCFRNISAIMRCLLYLQTTGTWYTAILRQRYSRTKRDCRSCAPWEAIWHGF